jgi:hypothetical protein
MFSFLRTALGRKSAVTNRLDLSRRLEESLKKKRVKKKRVAEEVIKRNGRTNYRENKESSCLILLWQ